MATSLSEAVFDAKTRRQIPYCRSSHTHRRSCGLDDNCTCTTGRPHRLRGSWLWRQRPRPRRFFRRSRRQRRRHHLLPEGSRQRSGPSPPEAAGNTLVGRVAPPWGDPAAGRACSAHPEPPEPTLIGKGSPRPGLAWPRLSPQLHPSLLPGHRYRSGLAL